MCAPLVVGGDDERRALHALVAGARAQGVDGARLHGHPGGVVSCRAESVVGVLLALTTLAGLLAPRVGAAGVVALGLVAAHGALGGAGARLLLGRRPSWALLLRAPGPATRRVVFATLDRGAPVVACRVALFVGALAGGAAVALGDPRAGAVVASALLVLAAVAYSRGRVARVSDSPEAAAAAALITYAARAPADPEVAVLVCGSAASDGAGVLAALDWYGVPRGAAEVRWVTGAPGPRSGVLRPPGWLGRPPAEARAVLEGSPGLAALFAAGWPVERLGGAPGGEASDPADLVAALVGERGEAAGAARSVG